MTQGDIKTAIPGTEFFAVAEIEPLSSLLLGFAKCRRRLRISVAPAESPLTQIFEGLWAMERIYLYPAIASLSWTG